MRDCFSRYAWVYFIFHTSDATEALKKFLADLRVDGIPSEAVLVRSDDGGEFNEEKFGTFCREGNKTQEFTTADNPEYNGVAERGLAIESAALTIRIFPGFDTPERSSLWAEAMRWTCDAYNRTATVANPKTVHRMRCFTEKIHRPVRYLS